MRYSIEPEDRIYVKGYGVMSFSKYMSTHLTINTVRNFLIQLKNLQQMQSKLLEKEQLKKQQELQVIWLVIKLLIK